MKISFLSKISYKTFKQNHDKTLHFSCEWSGPVGKLNQNLSIFDILEIRVKLRVTFFFCISFKPFAIFIGRHALPGTPCQLFDQISLTLFPLNLAPGWFPIIWGCRGKWNRVKVFLENWVKVLLELCIPSLSSSY